MHAVPSEPNGQIDRPQAPPARGALFRRWQQLFLRASLVGIAASVAIHLTLAILAAGIVVAVVGSGREAGTIAADAGLMTLTEAELEALDASPSASETAPSAPMAELTARTEALPSAPDLTGEAMKAPETGAGAAGAGAGGAGDLTGVGEGSGSGGGAGGGGAKFFGVEAVGNRFAYIVDISGSMAGPKMEALQAELVRSLDGLTERSQFVIVLFSSDARPLGGRVRWTDASVKNKTQAFRQIKEIAAAGATNPAPAFEAVFDLKPLPEAIYFMTDGLFNPEVATLVRQRNAAGGIIVPIHCIAFVSQDAEEIMRRIAEDSDGTYTYVPGPGIIQ